MRPNPSATTFSCWPNTRYTTTSAPRAARSRPQTESKGGGNLPSRNEIEEKLDLAETAEQVEIIVGKMPPQRQQIFRMSRFEHMPSREIAEQLNLSVRTVDKHLELALKELRKYLNIIPAIIVFLDILP